METYFHNDPRVREWVDQITEKIFTVCLLTGVDSDVEFQSGCQIVMKIVSLLQEIPTIPSEFLADGVKQLLEQQLPDKRVIESFPTYKATMDRMLRESILMIIDQNKDDQAAFSNLASSKEDADELIEEIHIELEGHDQVKEFEPHDPEIHVAETKRELELLNESAISALATVRIPRLDIQAGEDVSATVAKEGTEKDDSLTPIANNTNRYETKLVGDEVMQAPLKRVLGNIFPNSTVYWNKSLMGQIFLAQVEDVLICLHDAEESLSLTNIYKAGWKVLVCNTEDLTFPRRLERGIKQIQRTGKKS